MNKKLDDAFALLSTASDKIDKYAAPTAADLQNKAEAYKGDRADYEEVGKHANELALTSQATYVLQQIDSLKVPQTNGIGKINGYLKFDDETKRETFFSRNIEDVKSDIEYSLAKITKASGRTKVDKTIQKSQEQQEKIDDQLKQLQDQLKQLNQDGSGGTK